MEQGENPNHVLEGYLLLLFQTVKTLSEQQYLDCVYEGKRNGCQGGWPTLCYEWTKNNNNLIASQKDYPYVARGDGTRESFRPNNYKLNVVKTTYVFKYFKIIDLPIWRVISKI